MAFFHLGAPFWHLWCANGARERCPVSIYLSQSPKKTREGKRVFLGVFPRLRVARLFGGQNMADFVGNLQNRGLSKFTTIHVNFRQNQPCLPKPHLPTLVPCMVVFFTMYFLFFCYFFHRGYEKPVFRTLPKRVLCYYFSFWSPWWKKLYLKYSYLGHHDFLSRVPFQP